MACHSSRDTTLGILMTSSSLQVAQVVGHVDGVLPEHLQGHHVEGALVGGTTGAAQPSRWARSQFTAVTHAGHEAGEPLPMERWCSRNSAVTTAQMECRPRSSGPVEQQPSR
jgi:hypothetical protein